MQNILFLDIETNPNNKTIDYGALYAGKELHEKNSLKLEEWIAKADYICGHNIIAHDIPILKEKIGAELFQNKIYIDTLLWSPLLYAENPYHSLVKGYKIANPDTSNNPLSDCKLTRSLFIDLVNRFDELNVVEKDLLIGLLGKQESYNGLFNFVEFKFDSPNLLDTIRNRFREQICIKSDLNNFIVDHPIELAYALRLISTKKDDSAFAPWVVKQLPNAPHLLNQLRFTDCEDPSCTFCSSNLQPKKALFHFFEYEDFRSFDENEVISLQERTVKAGLRSNSFLAIFPTGGGKSLTFQLPALMRGRLTRQLTVVISPLVSLMKDQVDNLQTKFGINKAVAINGLLSPLEREEAIERVENGEAHILYVSPESLRSPTIYRLISQRSIARFVIDEAHCFSSWGQDFRVDYLFIGDFIKQLEGERVNQRIPISCFTATAKPQVVADIKSYFKKKLNYNLDEFITRADRKNLSYEVIPIEDETNKNSALLKLIETCEKPAIIYASRTKRVKEIHGFLEKNGFASTFFHGKLDKDVKKRQMDAFMNEEASIIVATSAFGMGVDKDNVKTVIHYNISDSLENYVQEAGRAGRDEKIQAKCYILFNETDLDKHFSLLQSTKINRNEIQQVWQSIKVLSNYGKKDKISHSALEIAQNAGWETEIKDLETKVKTAIAALEEQGFLKRNLNVPRVYATSLMVPNLASAVEKIRSNSIFTPKQIEHCSRILQRLVKDDECRVDYLADRTGLKLKEVQRAIQDLRDAGILGDRKDLTAFIDLTNSRNGSRKIIGRYLKIELALLDHFTGKTIRTSLRQINQNLLDLEIETSIDSIKHILNYWDIRNFIDKKRVDKDNEQYKIKIKPNVDIRADVAWRHGLTVDIFDSLAKIHESQRQNKTETKDLPVSFSLQQLKEECAFYMTDTKDKESKHFERSLLFLNQIKALKLEGGFMVSYNRFNITDVAGNIPFFKKENYEKMENHYEQKTAQIHIVGEYAKRKISSIESAYSYVNDYFSLAYNEFLARYFPGRRKKEIEQPLTPKRFKEICGDLDTDQLKIMQSKSHNTLVFAGPGSGKTKVLVHKIASLLLLEDIKPEQFLMLTFSKAASLEFRQRTNHLIPEFRGLIKITTFHGFCFQLIGQLGDLEKSKNVIQDCIKVIRNEEIDISAITNKSVLLLDEFQDINKDEWELIQTIISKAKNIRVIAVGDDDQNIYGFRGSSNDYMQAFRKLNNTEEFSLTKNYRSQSAIVQFNNELLKKIPNRLKTTPLDAVKAESAGRIENTTYLGSHLEQPLAEHIIEQNKTGTRVVLVRDNRQALLMRTFLSNLGQKTRLITGLDGFRFNDLYETRWFTNVLRSKTKDNSIILNTTWEDALDEFATKFRKSAHHQVCMDSFKRFETIYTIRKELVDWYEYAREIKMEDAIQADEKVILIATMHKAKGKEFDHVYVLLDSFNFANPEEMRLLYVAFSRAKESLSIHCNNDFFNEIEMPYFHKRRFTGSTSPPETFDVILGHKEIQLGSQKYPRALNIIKKLSTGDTLKKDKIHFGDSEAPGLAKLGEGNVLLFSKEFIQKKLNPLKESGYELSTARVEYLVYWYDSSENKEYLIVLPRLRFEQVPER